MDATSFALYISIYFPYLWSQLLWPVKRAFTPNGFPIVELAFRWCVRHQQEANLRRALNGGRCLFVLDLLRVACLHDVKIRVRDFLARPVIQLNDFG
jgi:hypothetical protein